MSIPVNISGSRGAAILGLSPWMTRIDVWIEIMESRTPGFCARRGFTLPSHNDSSSLRWGSGFESSIIKLAERKYGYAISHREAYCARDLNLGYDEEIITCHLDGIYENGVLHEGKTTTIFSFNDNWGEPGSDRIPAEYQIQVQHQMMLAQASQCVVSVLVFPRRPEDWESFNGYLIDQLNGNWKITRSQNDIVSDTWAWADVLDQMGYFHQFKIQADENLQKLMCKHYSTFWQNYVIAEAHPKIETYADIKKIVRDPMGTIIANEQVERWASEYSQLVGEGSGINKRKDELKVMILDYMRSEASSSQVSIDDDSVIKWVLRSLDGKKLHQYDGKTFR